MTSVDDLAGLANLDTSLMPSHLTIDDIASLFAVSGRAALIAKLRAAGLAAGHAGKMANAESKCVREGRITGLAATQAVLSMDLDLHAAAAAGNADRISAILQEHQKSSIELLDSLLEAKRSDSTPLMAACMNGHLACVRMLLQASGSSSIDAARADGSTALSDAVQYGHRALAEVLLPAARASCTRRLHHGWTILHVAVLHGRAECVQLLLDDFVVRPATDHACDDRPEAWLGVDDADHDGATSLSIAAQFGHEACLRKLLAARSDPSIRRADGLSPLAYAAASGHCDCLQALLAGDDGGREQQAVGAGAPSSTHAGWIDGADHMGWTPLLWATHNGHSACARALCAARADANARRFGRGLSPLECAALSGHAACIRVLVEYGTTSTALDGRLECFSLDAHACARLGAPGGVPEALRRSSLGFRGCAARR